MRYLIRLLLISVCLLTVSHSFAKETISTCLEQGKQEYAQQKYLAAKNTFRRCLRLDPHNEEALLSLGGVYLTQEEWGDAKSYFLAALNYMQKTSPYRSYTYSMLGDIAIKEHDNKAALNYYDKSLSYNAANVNSLVGKGVVMEAMGQKKEAAEIYQTAQAVEPLNLIARRRLIALEPIYFSDDEVLEALKQRYAVHLEQTTLADYERDLFEHIHQAEQRAGIAYLKEKFGALPEDYVVTLFKDTVFSRDVLTGKGYDVLQKQIAQDAIAVFQKGGISTQDIFALRDLTGEKIFLPNNTLTDSGIEVYQAALRGEKKFLLPSEDIPPTQAQIDKVNNLRQQLKEKGYTEITMRELELLRKQTDCSEKTMRSRMGLYVLPINKNYKRYYVLVEEDQDPMKGVLWYYIAKSRSRKNPSIEVPKNQIIQKQSWMRLKICDPIDGEISY